MLLREGQLGGVVTEWFTPEQYLCTLLLHVLSSLPRLVVGRALSHPPR